MRLQGRRDIHIVNIFFNIIRHFCLISSAIFPSVLRHNTEASDGNESAQHGERSQVNWPTIEL